MVETTFDIRLFPGGDDCSITSTVSGETEQQAELVAFAHGAARIISVAGPARAGAVVQALAGAQDQEGLHTSDTAPWSFTTVARFIDGASGPRIYFRFRSSEPLDGRAFVRVLANALKWRHRADRDYGRRLDLTAELLGRFAATGQIRTESEFDVALAAADVGWRSAGGRGRKRTRLELSCPVCGNAGGEAAFEGRVWPSDSAVLGKCARCGAGVWKRESKRPRAMREDIWSAMEAMRADLSSVSRRAPPATRRSGPLLEELKRVFAENGWPFAEVRGAPVLLTELSGPHGRWSFYAQVVDDQDLILLYSICPRRVPEGRREDVAQFLTRTNYGLAAGNFELDFEDGEIRYKTVVHLQGDELDRLVLKRLVRANGVAMETYLPEIESILAHSSNNPY